LISGCGIGTNPKDGLIEGDREMMGSAPLGVNRAYNRKR
jgi:hypothetical protein